MKANPQTKITPPKKLNVAVVGATGIVGQEFIKLLLEKNAPARND